MRPPAAPIDQIRWQPGGTYALAVEVFTIAQLRRKVAAADFERRQRVQFFVLTGVTQGATRHEIDFASIDARPGTWLLLRPGQLQRFDFSRPWAGWMIVFRPDLVLTAAARERSPLGALDALLAPLPAAVHLPPSAHAACCAAARRMAADAQRARASLDAHNALMLHQLGELLARLVLQAGRGRARGVAALAADDDRVARLRALQERAPQARRPVDWYAQRLGCSAKTLDRALQRAAGLSAKAWLDEAHALEAKRLLVHSAEPIKRVADRLGFADPSNFVKFFKRLAGCTPAAFRERQGATPA